MPREQKPEAGYVFLRAPSDDLTKPQTATLRGRTRISDNGLGYDFGETYASS